MAKFQMFVNSILKQHNFSFFLLKKEEKTKKTIAHTYTRACIAYETGF